MNEHDSEVMAGLFEREGWILTDDAAEADGILFNTCSVRQHAEERVWGALFELRERAMREPGLIIGVCGCMAQAKVDEIARRCPWVRVICGTQAFDRLTALVARAAAGSGVVIDTDMSRAPCLAGLPQKRRSRLKAFIPVMRGCENYCAYCVVPYVRGREVSRPLKELLAEVEILARDGCREIMLLGQNVNSYRAEGVSFAALLREVASVKGIERIRFMTSHPKDFPDELIRAMADIPKVCEHLHLPIQSGSDKILEMMNRRYTWGSYRALAEKIRGAVPGIALSTDVIVGFPGETDEDFDLTVRALEEVRYDGVFIFKYSDREGTRAVELQPHVPEEVIVQRHAALLKLQEEISAERNRELLGKSVEVLVEGYSPRNPDRLFGRSRTNKRVVFEERGPVRQLSPGPAYNPKIQANFPHPPQRGLFPKGIPSGRDGTRPGEGENPNSGETPRCKARASARGGVSSDTTHKEAQRATQQMGASPLFRVSGGDLIGGLVCVIIRESTPLTLIGEKCKLSRG